MRIYRKVPATEKENRNIHSPRVPSVEEMVTQIEALLEVLPARQLWINPDCGLKTRG